MKRGLPSTPSLIEENLFDDLPNPAREILAAGLGPRVHECWNVWHVRDVRGELLARGGGDLARGIELIRQEL